MGFGHVADAATQVDFRGGAGGRAGIGVNDDGAAALDAAVAHDAVSNALEALVGDGLLLVEFGRLQAQAGAIEDKFFAGDIAAVVVG